MAGANKRTPDYVPGVMREELDKLSKADLMEIAYDLAIMNVGDESAEEGAYQAIVASARALAVSQGRKAPKLAADFREIGRKHLAQIDEHAKRYNVTDTARLSRLNDARTFWQPYADGAK